jgi:GMP synthase (glutamine-hydrolysing)
MSLRLRYLLLQSRNPGDPMAAQEVRCFARALDCDLPAIEVCDLLQGAFTKTVLQNADMVLLGGSGHYSVAESPADTPSRPRPPWLDHALDTLREVYEMAKPTFASCWGFQAMAVALGGRCINDGPNAELGSIELTLTSAGLADPIFGTLPETFTSHAGHEDHVVLMPPDAILLASSARVREQAYCIADKPIYCTQFHPELDRTAVLERVVAYPEYVERIAQIPYEEFARTVRETPAANGLLRTFVRQHFE